MSIREERTRNREMAVHRNVGANLDDAFDALLVEKPKPAPAGKGGIRPDPVDDSQTVSAQAGVEQSVSTEFDQLKADLVDIAKCRAKLSKDMENDDLDKDERDTLKARSALLDAREKSVQMRLKLFHQNEIKNSGQVTKIRIQIEDYFAPEVKVKAGAL